MKLALIGVGAAGTRLVDQVLERQAATRRSFCHNNGFALDTTPDALAECDHVSEERQLLVGDTHRDVRAEGTDGDVDLGVSVARADGDEIRRAFDRAEIGMVDAILLVAGLGGGTGGGAGAVVLESLKAMYEIPVYVLGVLPHENEPDRRIHNAARSLRTFVPTADNTILFDNNSWVRSEDPADSYEQMNHELATRTVSVFAAGELESSSVAETRLDSSDVIRTLATGGVSTIGYASTTVETSSGGLLSWIRALFDSETEDHPTDAASVSALARRALNGRLTLPCEVSSADRAMIVLSGPPSACSRKGFESARRWLAEETGTVELLAGDEPDRRASELTAVVLLSTVTEVPRIDDMQHRAISVDG